MSDKLWWTIMGAWALGVVTLVGLLYRKVRRNDKLEEQMEMEYDRLFGPVCDEIARRADEKRALSKEAATPITENQWQQNARRAEALGFMDDDFPRAS